MKRTPEDECFVEVDGQKYAGLKDGLFLKYPEFFDALCLLPTDQLQMFFTLWNDIKKEKGKKELNIIRQGTITIKGDCSQCPLSFSDDPSCSRPEICIHKSSKLTAGKNELYFFFDVMIIRQPKKGSGIYFRDFREISIDEVLDDINQKKPLKIAAKSKPKKQSTSTNQPQR